MKRPWNTNYTYYVIKAGPCKKCGFAGKINDPDKAASLKKRQHIVKCPTCNGAGYHEERVSLLDALLDLEDRGMRFEGMT